MTQSYPNSEIYALVNQMRRASVSIPSNIAEGSGRKSDKDFKRFLEFAYGSALELETQIYVSYDIEFIDENALNVFLGYVHEIQKMIKGLDNKL